MLPDLLVSNLSEQAIKHIIKIIQDDNLEELKAIIKKNPTLLTFNEDETIFIHASKLGRIAVMQYLSEEDPQLLDLSNSQCRTALKKAIQNKQLDAIHLILEENFLFVNTEKPTGYIAEFSELLYELASLIDGYAHVSMEYTSSIQPEVSTIRNFLNFTTLVAIIKTQNVLIESLNRQNSALNEASLQKDLKINQLEEQIKRSMKGQEPIFNSSETTSLPNQSVNDLTPQFKNHKHTYLQIKNEEESLLPFEPPSIEHQNLPETSF